MKSLIIKASCAANAALAGATVATTILSSSNYPAGFIAILTVWLCLSLSAVVALCIGGEA